MDTPGDRSRTSVLGAACVSALIAGPLGGIIIALASIAGYPAGELAELVENSWTFVMVWAVVTGLFYAFLPAAVFGAAVGGYVRRGLRRGVGEPILLVHAIVGGAALGASFGVAVRFALSPDMPPALFGIAGGLAGAICGATVTAIVKSDHHHDLRPNDELQRTRPAQVMEPRR